MTLAAGSPIAQLAETGGLALLYPVAVAVPAFFFLSTAVSTRSQRTQARRAIEDVETNLQQTREANDRDRDALKKERDQIADDIKATDDAAETSRLDARLKALAERSSQLEKQRDIETQLAAQAQNLSAAAPLLKREAPRWFTWLEDHHSFGYAGVIVTAAVALFLLPGWPASLLPVVGLVVPFGLFLILDQDARNRPRGLTLAIVAPSLLALLLIGVFYAGLAGSGLGLSRGMYQFTGAAEHVVPGSGVYVELAQDSGLLYLHPCPSNSSNVVSVADSAINAVTSERVGDLGAGPSLWSIVFGQSGSGTGLRYACQ